MKITLLIILSFISTIGNSQTLSSNRDKVEAARKELERPIEFFQTCAVTSNDIDVCINSLSEFYTNPYRKYIIGGLLFEIDRNKSYALHKEAYTAEPNDLDFTLEYAIEMHRNGEYALAAQLYEKYLTVKTEDFRANVWLADCYINTGDTQKSIDNWNKADHSDNHTSIDFAIHTIYGRTDQLQLRSSYRQEIEKGNIKSIYPLIFLDMNWELDWWNTIIQEYFLEEDMKLIKSKFKESDNDYKIIQAYINIKKVSESQGSSDSITTILTRNNLILESNPIPSYGKMTSDLIRICSVNRIIDEKDYYIHRGEEILNLAKKTKDIELLNIYAYLQARVNGKVDPSIDKLGWTDFKDERFAVSYFIGKADNNKSDDPELAQAMTDFPNSSKIYWIKTNCAKIENKPLKPLLIELIKREFKTLGSDPGHYSYPLKAYYGFLENEK